MVIESTNVLVQGSIEASSPEERHENDSSLSSLLPLTASTLGPEAASKSEKVESEPTRLAETHRMVSPLLTQGVFPYQPNPIAAVIAAGLTMAMMSLKETGKVDLRGLGYILNSSAFYAGLAGSLFASVTHKQTMKVIEATLSRGVTKTPEVLKPALTSKAAQQLGHIVNGFTYTFAISWGFENFSHIWKYATRNIPEAQTFVGFLKADTIRQKQVALNILYYTVMDKVMQQRIFTSIYNHRILTFEFIATNIALYVGGMLGKYVADKYGAKTPLLKKIGPMMGSITGGLLVQAIPNSWTSAINAELVEFKIKRHQAELAEDLKQLREGIRNRFYPNEEHSTGGYWVRGVDLQADIERALRERDMIASLQLQKILYQGESQMLFMDLGATFGQVEGDFRTLLSEVKSSQNKDLKSQLERWISERRSPEEIQKLGQMYITGSPNLRFYEFLLEAALERCQEGSKSAQSLVEIMGKKPLDPGEVAAFGF